MHLMSDPNSVSEVATDRIDCHVLACSPALTSRVVTLTLSLTRCLHFPQHPRGVNVGERLDDAIDILRNHAEGQQVLGPNSYLPPNNANLTHLDGHVVGASRSPSANPFLSSFSLFSKVQMECWLTCAAWCRRRLEACLRAPWRPHRSHPISKPLPPLRPAPTATPWHRLRPRAARRTLLGLPAARSQEANRNDLAAKSMSLCNNGFN